MNRKDKEKRQIRYSDAKATAQKQQSGFTPDSITLPKGVHLFSFREDKLYRLDVIPFFTKEGNPMCDAEMLHWERTYWAHGNIGANNGRYACLRRTFGKKCPICDHAALLQKKGGDPELIKELGNPSKRQLIALINQDDRDKGIQVYEGPYYFGLGQLIDIKIDSSSEDSTHREFFYLDKGSRLTVRAKQEAFQGRSFFKPVNVEMELRRKPLPESILDEVPCLDDLPREVPYDKLNEIFLQAADVEEEEKEDEDKQSRTTVSMGGKNSSKNGQDDDEEPDEPEEDEDEAIKLGSKIMHKTYGLCEVIKDPAKTKGKLTLEDEEGEEHSVSPDTVKLATKEDIIKARKKAEEPEEDEDEDKDDQEDDEEPDEEPEEKPKKVTKVETKKKK